MVMLIYDTFQNVPPHFREKIRSLNFRDEGAMRDVLRHCKHKIGKIAIIIDGAENVLAWGMQTNGVYGYDLMLYTRVTSRRKGLGTQIARAIGASGNNKTNVVCGCTSARFWEQTGIPTTIL